jgi:hypothetical protein
MELCNYFGIIQYPLLPGLDSQSDIHETFIIYNFAMAQSSNNYDVYQPRNPKASAYYKCVENHFGELEHVWDDMYKARYGYWRTYA